MKKIILGALALMIGAIGFAQSNNSTVNQTGIDLTSSVNQAGNSNTAIQDQVGDLMWVTIKQVGTSNYAKQDQVGDPRYFSNNIMKIDQNGNRNDARQKQDWTVGANAYAKQVGSDNLSRQTQLNSWGDIADVRQNGTWNKAYQTQTHTAAVAYIVQENYNNKATQNQLSGKYNYAYARQTGRSNTSMQIQNGTGFHPFPGDYNKVYVYQYGNGNNAYQDQSTKVSDGSTNVPGGNYSYIMQEVTSRDGIAKQYQYGNEDEARITQKGGRDNRGYQTQDIDSFNADARLMQNGNYNRSWQNQTGMDMTSIVNQTGSGHVSHTTQSGASNITNVTQTN